MGVLADIKKKNKETSGISSGGGVVSKLRSEGKLENLNAPVPVSESVLNLAKKATSNIAGLSSAVNLKPTPIVTPKPTPAPIPVQNSVTIPQNKPWYKKLWEWGSKVDPEKQAAMDKVLNNSTSDFFNSPEYKQQSKDTGAFASGFYKGSIAPISAARGITNAVNGLFNNNEFERLITGKNKNLIEQPQAYKVFDEARQEVMKGKSFAQNIPESATQAITEMLPAIATGGTSGLAYMGVQSGGRNTQQALDEGATAKQALAFGAITGTAEALTEKMFGFVPGMKMFDEALSGLGGNLTKNLGKIGANFAKKSLGEGFEEVLMEPITGAAEKYTYNSKKKWGGVDFKGSTNPLDWKAVRDGVFDFTQMAQSGAMGAIVGGLMSGVAIPSQVSDANTYRKEIADNIQRQIYIGYSMPENTQSYQKSLNLMDKGSNTTMEEYQDYMNTLRQEIPVWNEQQNEQQNQQQNQVVNPAIKPNKTPVGMRPLSGSPQKTFTTKAQQTQPIMAQSTNQGQTILPEQNKSVESQPTANKIGEGVNVPTKPTEQISTPVTETNNVPDTNVGDNYPVGTKIKSTSGKVYNITESDGTNYRIQSADGKMKMPIEKAVLDKSYTKVEEEKPVELMVPKVDNKPSTITEVKAKRINSVPEGKSYDEYQKMIDDASDEIVKKYSEEELLKAPISDYGKIYQGTELENHPLVKNGRMTHKGDETKLTDAELNHLKDLYERRDQVEADENKQTVDNITKNVDFSKVGKEWVASKDAVEKALHKMIKSNSLSNVFGHDTNTSLEKIAEKLYNDLIHSTDAPRELHGEFKYAIEVAKNFQESIFGQSTLPLLEQINQIIKGMTGTTEDAVKVPEQIKIEAPKPVAEPLSKIDEIQKPALEEKVDKLDEKLDSIIETLSGKMKEKDGVKNDKLDENVRASADGTKSESVPKPKDTGKPDGISKDEGDGGGKDLRVNDVVDENKPTRRPKENEPDAAVVPDNSDSERISNERTYDISEHKAGNYKITSEDVLFEGGKKTRFKNNIAAISLVKKLEAEGRRATPDEQKILIKYVGWGGLKEAFSEKVTYENGRPVFVSDKADWEKEYNKLKEVLTPDEYKTAQTSMQNAHYTRPEIINAMYDISRHLGFNGGKILEPAAGIGHFMGLLPEDMSKSSFFVVEKDIISGLITKYLYPDSKVRVNGFENVKLPNNYFDMAISNVPFGNIPITDSEYASSATGQIHNYFFAKSLDKVKEGGLVIFVTSTGTMDTSRGDFREYIADRADLIGAFRLPSDTFKENAGTEVTTDLIILRKRTKGEMPKGESFGENKATKVKVNDYSFGEVNEYFVNNPDNVLGKFVVDKLTNGRLGVESTGDTLSKLIEGVRKLPKDIFNATKGKTEQDIPEETVKDKAKGKNNSYLVKDGRVFKVVDGELTAIEEKDKTKIERVKALVGLKSIVGDLIWLQSSTTGEVDLTDLQKKLNKSYDEFVKKYGYISENTKLIKEDPEVYRLEALEMAIPITEGDTKAKQTYKKADIFSKRVITPYVRATVAKDAKEALAIVMYEDGNVDLDRITKLARVTEDKAISELEGMIYNNPQGGWELESEYLSGNVKDKLIRARQAAEIDSKYDENVIALEKVQPTIKPYGQFKVTLGAAWIPVNDMKTILTSILDTPSIKIAYNGVIGKWKVELTSYSLEAQNYAVGNFNAGDVITKALNGDKVEVKKKDSEGKSYTDMEKTNIAKAKVRELEQKFSSYINQSIDMQKNLETAYNDKVNIFVERKFSKQDKTYIGMSNEVKLRPHQVQAVERTVYGGNILLAHDVGFGKTYIMLAAAMELKRLGIAKKPLMIVPNNKLTDFKNDMLGMYPQAKILTVEQDDFKAENIKGLFARIATNDWDCIMVRHSSFEKIPVSPTLEEEHYQSMIRDLRVSLTEAKTSGSKKYSQSDIQKQIDKYMDKIAEIRDRAKKYDVVTFEEMGVDYLFVDEAHEYKNLEFATTKGDVKGVNSNGVAKTHDLYMKTKYITSLHGGKKGLVFATGTPVSNALNEMYTMFKYLRPDILEDTGTTSFDSWISMFGQVESKPEVKTGGVMAMVERFRGFHNLEELMTMFKEFADMKYDASELGLKLPELEGGKPTIVECDPHPDYESYVQNVILKRIEKIPKGKKSKGDDNHLSIATDTAKATLDMRLISNDAKDFKGSKISKVVDLALKNYKESNDYKGTQLIFIDKGASEETTGFDTSIEVINRLVKSGVPKTEIALAKKYTTAAQLQKLFADVNSGKIRFLVGTYEKMSTGLNVQERLVAIHEVNAPYKPSQILQAEGRMMRQGNLHEKWGKKVKIYRYAVIGKTSYDAIKWQIQETKIKAISKLTKGDKISEIEADEDANDSAVKEIMMIKAKALGDERFTRQIELQESLPQIESERNVYYAENNKYKRIIRDSPELLNNLKKSLGKITKDIEEYSKYPKDVMEITVNGKKYKQNKEDKFKKDEASPKRLAGEAILKAVDNAYFKNGITVIGEYKGFTLYAEFQKSVLFIKNNFDGYTDINIKDLTTPEGIIDRIESRISNAPAVRKSDLETNISKVEKDIATAESKVTNEPFPKEDKYQEMVTEKQTIDSELETNVPLTESNTKYRTEPKLAEVEAELAKKVEENVDPPMLTNTRGSAAFFNKPRKEGHVEFVNKDVGERFENAKKVKTPLLGKITTKLEEIKKNTTRGRFAELERGSTYAELRLKLLQFTKAKDIALARTLTNLQGLVAEMDARDYEFFNAKVVFEDLLEDAKEGKLLSFGLKDEVMVQEELDNINKQIGSSTIVENAIILRNKLWDALKKEYIEATKAIGFNTEDRFKRKNYFRHLVIEHVQKERMLTGTGQKLKTPRGSGFLKMRHGYEGDIVSDYLQAEAEVMAQMAFDIERTKIIKYVETSEHNIIKSLKVKAKQMNADAMENIYTNEATDASGAILLDSKGRRDSTSEKTMKKYASYMSMSFAKLEKMQNLGNLWEGDNGEFKNISFVAKGDARVYQFLSELAKQDNIDGVVEARTILKYTKARELFIKETLGDYFKTWEKIIPEGYNIWQATKGNAMYMTYSIPEQLADQLVNDMVANAVVDKTQLKKIMTQGLPYREMVLPDDVINTVDNLTSENLKGVQAGFIMNSWKQWQLISPRRLVKYNIRNISGDLDKIFLGNPTAVSKIPKAMKELYETMYGQLPMSADMKDWFERGGMSSFLQVNEMGDVNELKMFVNTAQKKNLNAIKGYWKHARLSTDYREAILRYAAYLSFKEQIDAKGRPNNYGGSLPSEINALRNSRDKAYQLSNELLGAYDDLSVMGQHLRAKVIPFYSFMEVNMKTYYRSMKNIAADSNKMVALGRASAVGGKKLSFMVARNIGRFVLGATFLTGMLALWNNLFFRDEEEDIPEGDRKRAHLTLWRDSSGRPIYFTRLGSLTDALEWFGMGQIQNDIKEVLNGKKTIKEQVIEMAKTPVNKIYGAAVPFHKMILEYAFGMSSFPDIWKKRTIRDRGEFLAQGFGLANEYKAIFGKPSRGYADSFLDFIAYRTDPKETAYYETLDNKRRYKETVEGKKESLGSYTPSDKSNALYYYKMSLRYKDKQSADKYLDEYLALGGTKKGYVESMQQLSPSYGIENEDKFKASLDSSELAKFETAKKFYQEILSGSEFVDGEYAKAYIQFSELRSQNSKLYKKMKEGAAPISEKALLQREAINEVDATMEELTKVTKTEGLNPDKVDKLKGAIYKAAYEKIMNAK
jgi:N12 class adenine-specific DNA methylase